MITKTISAKFLQCTVGNWVNLYMVCICTRRLQLFALLPSSAKVTDAIRKHAVVSNAPRHLQRLSLLSEKWATKCATLSLPVKSTRLIKINKKLKQGTILPSFSSLRRDRGFFHKNSVFRPFGILSVLGQSESRKDYYVIRTNFREKPSREN